MDDQKQDAEEKKPEAELDEKELERVSGGVVKPWGLVVGTLDSKTPPG